MSASRRAAAGTSAVVNYSSSKEGVDRVPQKITNEEMCMVGGRNVKVAGVVKFLGFNPLPNGDHLAQRLVSHRKACGFTHRHTHPPQIPSPKRSSGQLPRGLMDF